MHYLLPRFIPTETAFLFKSFAVVLDDEDDVCDSGGDGRVSIATELLKLPFVDFMQNFILYISRSEFFGAFKINALKYGIEENE